MSKRVRRGFDPGAAFVRQLPDYGLPGEISISYADFLSILVEYDKRGVNPLGSTIESRFVRQYVNSTYCYWLS